MHSHFVSRALGLVSALALTAACPAQAQIAYAINNMGTTLIKFDVSASSGVVVVGNISGAVRNLIDLEFR